jgi:SAM-dependent methyltransferase
VLLSGGQADDNPHLLPVWMPSPSPGLAAAGRTSTRACCWPIRATPTIPPGRRCAADASITPYPSAAPYKFMATIGKRVIHPGGRVSTEALLARARITATTRVFDVGCGVATAAIEISDRSGAQITAVDIAPLMLERAEANVRAAKDD